MNELEAQLRLKLANTSEAAPRPVSSLELPFGLQKLIAPPLLKTFRQAAVLVPILQRPEGHTVLLTRRSEQLRSHKGQISFPGGGRDAEDVSLAANALREAQEEVGLDPQHVEVIGYLEDYPTLTRYVVTPVVALVRNEAALKPDPREVAEVFEVPLSFVLDPASYEQKALTRKGFNVPFYELNHGGYRIWGATAGMLWNLVELTQRTA